MNTRSTDVAYGMLQSSATLIPYTTNTAITSPLNASDPRTLPQRDFDGEIDTTSLNVQFTSGVREDALPLVKLKGIECR
jgi:hypothetical protein